MASARQEVYGPQGIYPQVEIIELDNKIPFIISQLQPAAEALALRFLNKVYDRSQELVPVDTGALKESGHIYREPRAVVLSYNALNNIGITYAAYVEYGTRTTRAQPYVNPAVQQSMDVFRSGLEDLLG